MLMIHAETNILNDVSDLSDYVDIVKLYTIDDSLSLTESYFNYENKNSMNLIFNEKLLNDKKLFDSNDINNLKNLIELNQPLIVLNYTFMKKTLENYDIFIDNYQIIDMSKVFKKLNFYGNIQYSLANIISHSNIDHKNNRLERGVQMLELYKLLTNKCELTNENLLYINNYYKNDKFETIGNKFYNKKFDEINITTLLTLLSFDNIEIKLDECTNQEFKFNLIRYILEDYQDLKSIDFKSILDKNDFDSKIKSVFEGSEKILNIDLTKLNVIYNMCDLYFNVNNNKVDLNEIRKKFIESSLEDLDLEEISF